jgi:hypothetical protein
MPQALYAKFTVAFISLCNPHDNFMRIETIIYADFTDEKTEFERLAKDAQLVSIGTGIQLYNHSSASSPRTGGHTH